jgi:hypothetical protein
MEPIAKDTMFGCQPGGERFEIQVEVGSPYQYDDRGEEWACPISLFPLYRRLADIHGGSSLQALCLALTLAKTLLDDFVEKGGQLTYDTGESFDLNAVFGTQALNRQG